MQLPLPSFSVGEIPRESSFPVKRRREARFFYHLSKSRKMSKIYSIISHSSPGERLHYTLRIASAMCFIGHGAWGILIKPAWFSYFAVFGIAPPVAVHLMPFLGSFDILLGIVLLVYPLRAIPAWLMIWGLVTALLRPLSGEPVAEFIERAGNFGAPFAFLLLAARPVNVKALFSPAYVETQPDAATLVRLKTCLRITVFLLLAGHGWLNLIGKKGLIAQYTALGFSAPYLVAHAVGIFEILGAVAILVRPLAPLLLFFLCWKMISELFYPHYELFEWLERGGSYGCLLALWFVLKAVPLPGKNSASATSVRSFVPA